MLDNYPPSSRLHHTLLVLFIGPFYYLTRLHRAVMAHDRGISTALMQTLWILAFFCGGGLAYGATVIWRVLGDWTIGALGMMPPMVYELVALNEHYEEG
jgi:hypothetical protein